MRYFNMALAALFLSSSLSIPVLAASGAGDAAEPSEGKKIFLRMPLCKHQIISETLRVVSFARGFDFYRALFAKMKVAGGCKIAAGGISEAFYQKCQENPEAICTEAIFVEGEMVYRTIIKIPLKRN